MKIGKNESENGYNRGHDKHSVYLRHQSTTLICNMVILFSY